MKKLFLSLAVALAIYTTFVTDKANPNMAIAGGLVAITWAILYVGMVIEEKK